MPIYGFKCTDCNKVFDSIENYSDMILLRHPECPTCSKANSVIRLATAPGTYNIAGDNSASTRPRGGAFKRKNT